MRRVLLVAAIVGLAAGAVYAPSVVERLSSAEIALASRLGDIVAKRNGQAVAGLSTLVQAIQQAATNGAVRLEYIRLERVGNRIRATRGTAKVQIVPQPVDNEGRTPQGV